MRQSNNTEKKVEEMKMSISVMGSSEDSPKIKLFWSIYYVHSNKKYMQFKD